MLAYLTGSEEINHSLMNDLFESFDGKMVKMLSSGKSFILGVGDGNGSVGDWSVYPMNSILGQPFFFFTGTPAIIDNIVGYEGISYNHAPFVNAENAVPVDYLDITGEVAYVSNIFDSFGTTYYDLIGKSYTATQTDDYLSFFDYSLEAHQISGYYLAERLGVTNYDSGYHLPERHLKYGLADIFAENLGNLTWESEWNKYKCLRFHNFNSTGRLNLTFEETSQNFTLGPFDCRSFRNYSGVWEESSFRYFQDYKSGDPLSYSYWSKGFAGIPWGKSSLMYHPKSRNSQSANNLLNPSILLNYVDLFSYRNGAITEAERSYGDYPAGLNAFFHFMHEEQGADITNLYCIGQPNYFSGSYSSGDFSHTVTSTGYYQYQNDLLFPSGANNIDLIIKFPRASQVVTLDLAPVSSYGPNSVNCYAKYESGDDWLRLFSATTTGWIAGQRKSLYLTDNRPFKEYKFKLNGFEESHLSFGLDGLELHGLFDDPRVDSSVIGNLFYHRGEILKAKISKTLKCFDGVTPQSTFERIVFNGLDKLTDWQLEHQISVTELSDGKLYLNNLDSDNYVDLVPISTNLFKVGGYDYSVASGVMPLSLDNGITIDNHIFEVNSIPGNFGFSTFPGKATHLYNDGNSFLNSAVPPVLFADLSLTHNPASGTFVYDVWGDDFTWPDWVAGTGYAFGARVSKNGQRYKNTLDSSLNTLNTGVPVIGGYLLGSEWLNTIYSEPYNASYVNNTGDYYNRSGMVFQYGFGSLPSYNTAFYDITHAGNIEWKWDDFYSNYYKDTWILSGTSVVTTWGNQYTGIIKLQSDTVSLLKTPAVYGFSGGALNNLSDISLNYEVEGLTFNCSENLTLPQGSEISFTEDHYGKFFGPFIGTGNSLSRDRKGWFRGNGFGYMSDYLFPTNNWLGPNANSLFTTPRFPRPYTEVGMAAVTGAAIDPTGAISIIFFNAAEQRRVNYDGFFNLISGYDSLPSGRDFEVRHEETPIISDFQLLHSVNPLINAGQASSENLFNNGGNESNFFYYKNDRRIENSYFDKDAFDVFNAGPGYIYGATRPTSFPLGVLPDDAAFTYTPLYRRFYVPLMSEHYNLLAQTSNQCKYADYLPLENFIYWSYSGATFQFRQYKSRLANLQVVQNYSGPDIGMGAAEHQQATNITYFDTILFGNNHNKILPSDYFIGFNKTGITHGAFFNQFFQDIGVVIKDSSDFPASILAASTGDIGTTRTEHVGIELVFEDIPPVPRITFNSSGEYATFDSIPVSVANEFTNSISTGSYYNYVPDNFSNFGYVTYDNWNTYLNSLGISLPMTDAHFPLELESLSISTQNGRQNYLPAGNVTNGTLQKYASSPPGPLSSPATTSGDAGFAFTNYGFNGYLGEWKLVYSQETVPFVIPRGIFFQTEATDPLFYQEAVGAEVHFSLSGDDNNLWVRPNTLWAISLAGSIHAYNDFCVTDSQPFICKSSGYYTELTTIATDGATHTTNTYHPILDSNGELKCYPFQPGLGLGEYFDDKIKTRDTFDIDAYSTFHLYPVLENGIDLEFDSLIDYNGFYSKPETTSIIIGNELVTNDNYKKKYGYWDISRRVVAFNSIPSTTVKYFPSGHVDWIQDEPLLTEGNYLAKNYKDSLGGGAASDLIRYQVSYPTQISGGFSSSISRRIGSYPYMIEAPQTGIWRAEVASFRTVDLT